MATATDPKEKQDAKYNPAEQDWAQTVQDDLKGLPTTNEGIASKEGAVDQARARLRQGEEQAASGTQPTGNVANQEQQPGLYSGATAAKAAIKGKMNPIVRRWLYVGIPSALISAVFAFGAFAAGAVVSLKELALDFVTKNHYSSYSKRTPKLQKKIFQEPGNCTGIRCRYSNGNGVSDKEIEKYKKAGWDVDVGEKDGKKWIRSATMPGDNGQRVTVDANNFEQMYSQHRSIRGGSWVISSPKALVYRAKHAVKKYAQFNISRSKLFKKASDARKYFYGGGKKSDGRIAGPSEGQADPDQPDPTEALDDASDEVKDAAENVQREMEDCNYECRPSVRPDLNDLDLDLDKAAGVGSGILKGGLKGAFFGVTSLIDKACQGYQILRTLVIGAKIFKYSAFILFAISFMTHFDALKAGEIGPESLAFIAGWLIRPSTEKDSLGKTAANSNLYSLITEGKVQSRSGLGFGVMGTAALKFLQGAKRLFEQSGANASTCKHVNSWYGQIGLAAIGITTTILSGGAGSLVGIAGGALVGAAVAVLAQYVTPFLIQFIAGTAAPDPDDEGGGYRAGEAIASGLGGFAGELGKGGLMPLGTDDVATVARETEAEMAKINEVERMGKSPFDPSVPNSIANKLALAILPFTVAPISQTNMQNLAGLATSPLNMLGNALNQLFYKSASAQASANYGGEFCADEEMISMNVVTDAYCNAVYGQKAAVIDDPVYSTQEVLDYMIDKGHVNEEDGSAKSDEYKKFIKSCVEGAVPLTEDGAPIDVADNSTDTRLCRKDENNDDFRGHQISKEQMFRIFVMDTNILDGMDSSADGTLGIDQ